MTDTKLTYAQISKLPFRDLEALVFTKFPSPPARTIEERRKNIQLLSVEDLTVVIEYARRHIDNLQSDGSDLATYEDTFKALYIPELLRRLESGELKPQPKPLPKTGA